MDTRWWAVHIRARTGLTYGWRHTTVPGCKVIEAVWEDDVHPIGSVWFIRRGHATIEICESYVPLCYRRLGIRTFLHEKMLESHPSIVAFVTAASTSESKPWLLKMGFKRSPADGWRLCIPRLPAKRV